LIILAEGRGGEMVRQKLLEVAKTIQAEKDAKRKSRRARRQPLLFTLKGNRWAAWVPWPWT